MALPSGNGTGVKAGSKLAAHCDVLTTCTNPAARFAGRDLQAARGASRQWLGLRRAWDGRGARTSARQRTAPQGLAGADGLEGDDRETTGDARSPGMASSRSCSGSGVAATHADAWEKRVGSARAASHAEWAIGPRPISSPIRPSLTGGRLGAGAIGPTWGGRLARAAAHGEARVPRATGVVKVVYFDGQRRSFART